jgi:hypothetical protein
VGTYSDFTPSPVITTTPMDMDNDGWFDPSSPLPSPSPSPTPTAALSVTGTPTPAHREGVNQTGTVGFFILCAFVLVICSLMAFNGIRNRHRNQ